MFLAERTAQAEYFDSSRPPEEQKSFYSSLRKVNRLCLYSQPFKSIIAKRLGPSRCKQLSLLDLGAGDGHLGGVLTNWASKQGWAWNCTSLDLNHRALQLGIGNRVAGSVLELPFPRNSVDVVIASQMTHHLASGDVIRHFSEAWRVARRAVLISDLHRNAFLYFSLKILLRFGKHSPEFVNDALVSVRRGWRLSELRELANASELKNIKVQLYFGTRTLIYAKKD